MHRTGMVTRLQLIHTNNNRKCWVSLMPMTCQFSNWLKIVPKMWAYHHRSIGWLARSSRPATNSYSINLSQLVPLKISSILFYIYQRPTLSLSVAERLNVGSDGSPSLQYSFCFIFRWILLFSLLLLPLPPLLIITNDCSRHDSAWIDIFLLYLSITMYLVAIELQPLAALVSVYWSSKYATICNIWHT